MNALSDPEVEIVTLAWAAQMAKTEVLLNFLGWQATEDGGPALLVYPDEKTADRVMRDRIAAAIRTSPKWRTALLNGEDSITSKSIGFRRGSLDTAWANSPMSLAQAAKRYVCFDEVEKYPKHSGFRDAGPVPLGIKRTRTFQHRRKVLLISTPVAPDGTIWTFWERSSQYRYRVPCPHCRTYQALDFFRGLRWPKRTLPEKIRSGDLAWYECDSCKKRIKSRHKARMLKLGAWATDEQRVTKTGAVMGSASRRHCGYHISALYSPWDSFSELAARWLESQGDEAELQEFYNQELGLPWKKKLEQLREDSVRAHARDSGYQEGTVPNGARLLTAGVDVQEGHFWFVVRAWGLEEESWLVRQGQLATWRDVEKMLGARYQGADGRSWSITKALIDSGNKPSGVYEFCQRLRPLAWPSKGTRGALSSTVKIGTPHPGVVLYSFRADYFKDWVARFVLVDDDRPSRWHLPEDISEEYCRQMCGEAKEPRTVYGHRVFQWVEVGPNHLWDCEVLALVAAEIEGLRFWHEEELQGEEPEPPSGRSGRRGDDELDLDDFLDGSEEFWDGMD